MNTKQLRQKILDLAIKGKLVPQDPNDEPASKLIERIREEKEQLIKEGKLKRDKNESYIFVGDDKLHYEKFADGSVVCIEDEIPFEIPESWAWCHLSDVVAILNGDRGQNYPSKDKLQQSGIPFISAINIEQFKVSKKKLLYMSEKQYSMLRAGKLEKNDILYCIRGSLGKCGIFQMEQGAIASSLVIVRPYFKTLSTIKYLLSYLTSDFIRTEIYKYDSGTAQPNLAANDFSQFLIPLPPQSEQKRISETVETLLQLVETIDSDKIDLSNLIKQTNKSKGFRFSNKR